MVFVVFSLFDINNRISGRHPYVANDERRLLEIIRSQKLRFDLDKFRNLSSEGSSIYISMIKMNKKILLIGLDFLQGMLVYDTVHRRTMGELTVHPWLTVYFFLAIFFLLFYYLFQGRSDKGPTKDIITMMREFQAENDQRQAMAENNLTTLINATVNHTNVILTANDQSQILSLSTSLSLNKQQKPSNDHDNMQSIDNQSKTISADKAKISTNTLERRTIIDRNKPSIKTNRFTSDTFKVIHFFIQNYFIIKHFYLYYIIVTKTFD